MSTVPLNTNINTSTRDEDLHEDEKELVDIHHQTAVTK